MGRRASSGISIGQILGIAAAILGFLVAVFLLIRVVGADLIGGGESGSRGLAAASELNLSNYIENANSLRGNVYRLSGKVEETLKWTADRGRLISFKAAGAGETSLVPILVPEQFSSTNIDRGDEFELVVRVDRGGLLVAEKIEQG